MTMFFPDLSVSPRDDKQAQALAYWQHYGDLRRNEVWRWTPLDALRTPARRFEAADYQFSLDDSVTENFGSDDADQALLSLKDAPFTALNLAFLADALLLNVPAGAEVAELNAINIDMFARRLQCSRVHIRAEEQSKSAFWLDFNVTQEGAQLPVLTIEAAENTEVDVALCFNGSRGSAQVAQVLVRQAQGSRVRLNALQSNGALIRLDITALIEGSETHFAFGGVQLLQGEEVGDIHVNVRHLVEGGESHQIVRGALADQTLGIFDGMIYVAHGAQQTDARQDSRYILLSDEARSHSVPRLEIYADDVQCAHGSTTGKIDAEALFYLQSRGISLAN
ncbi:MAG: SufD family Fe-S cluster assembly protein, partial [Cardiobacteriaceae bacterium]|nr:SufD family Fe-S cluster assembly protein [Cardiobacteriaceae bacterium]